MAAGMGPLRGTKGLGPEAESDGDSPGTGQQLRLYGWIALGVLAVVVVVFLLSR